MFECIFVGDSGSGNDDQRKVANSMEKLIHNNCGDRCMLFHVARNSFWYMA